MSLPPPTGAANVASCDAWVMMSAICAERELFTAGDSFICWAARNTVRASLVAAGSRGALRRLGDVLGPAALRQALEGLHDEEAWRLLERIDAGGVQAHTAEGRRARLLALAGVLEGAEVEAGAPNAVRTLRKHSFLAVRRGA